MPLTHAGSLASAAGVDPRKPWLPLPDQSRTDWPLPSFKGHQPSRGKSAAEAADGSSRLAAMTAAAIVTRELIPQTVRQIGPRDHWPLEQTWPRTRDPALSASGSVDAERRVV